MMRRMSRKVKLFYFVFILSFLLCVFSLSSQLLQSWGHGTINTVNLNLVSTDNKIIKTDSLPEEKKDDIIISSIASQYKNSIKISLEEISASARNIPAYTLANPKIILLVTTWRSGSTFLGEAMSSHEAFYYHYEPLTSYNFQNLDNPIVRDACLMTIDYLSKCQYAKVDKYMEWIKQNDTIMLTLNNKISRACNFLGPADCTDINFLAKACSFFPIQLFKVVRLGVGAFEKFVKNNAAVHIIFLARDPRAIYASRKKVAWCLENPICGDPSALCQKLETDLSSMSKLQTKYPNQVHLVKYEDLAQDPVTNLQNLFTDLDVHWSTRISEYLKTHTSSNVEEPWSTYRISKLRIDHWKSTLEPSMIGDIQNKCDNFMTNLQYTFIDVTKCDDLLC